MKINFILIAFVVLLSSCSRVQTLNTVDHSYSNLPNQIIWIQLAGFSDEHLPLLKFNSQSSDVSLFSDRATCMGRMWNYSLFKLRPNAQSSFLSQIFGSKNVTNNCKDLERKPVWSKFSDKGFNISVLENEVDDQNSLEKYVSCDNGSSFAKLNIWRMSVASLDSKKFFHYQEPKNEYAKFNSYGVHYDQACQRGPCFSSLLNNVKSLFGNYIKDSGKSLFIVRDFSFLKAINKKDITLAKEKLIEIEQVLKWIELNTDKSVLIVLTGAEATMIDYPAEGKEWEDYLKTSKNINFKNTTLLNTVISMGSASENFCGLFEESDFYRRLQFESPGKKFNWDNLNPLTN
jgi:hypothetical protein